MRFPLTAVAALALLPSAAAQPVATDYSTWTEESPNSTGNWVLSAGNTSVLQTINNDPTFFVSPNVIFNTTVSGTIEMTVEEDDDFVGFVFGYETPNAGTSNTNWDFLLFDWRNFEDRSSASFPFPDRDAGFRLLDVDCTYGATGCGEEQFTIVDRVDPFGPIDYGNGVDLLIEDVPAAGWEYNTLYTYELRYTADSVRVQIQGGTGTYATPQTIFDVSAADVGLTSFPSGRFGFYNNSQAGVRYAGFSEDNGAPIAAPDSVTVTQGAPATFNVLGNDFDPDSDTISLVSFTQPSAGALLDNGGGSFTYTANAGSTSDSFTYTITDGAITSTTTVTITVNAPIGISGAITAGNCSFPRPSATKRCFPQITGTSTLPFSQRYTLFFRIEGTGGAAAGFSRVAKRGEVKPNPGQTLTNPFSLRTFSSDPDGQYDLVLLAELDSVAAPGPTAVELDRFAFEKGDAFFPPALRARPTAAGLRLSGANPSDGRTRLELALPADEHVAVAVYDALGRRVAVAHDALTEAGYTEVAVDLSALPAGFYVARAQGASFAETLRLTVVR